MSEAAVMAVEWEMQPNGALLWLGDDFCAKVWPDGAWWRWHVWHVWSERVPDPDPRSSGERILRSDAQRSALERIEKICLHTLGQMGWDVQVEQDGGLGPRLLCAFKEGEE